MSEPRTEAGKRLLEWLYLNGYGFPTDDKDYCEAAILAIEAEAAEPAPLDLRIEQERRSAFLAAQEALRRLSPRSKAIGTIGHMVERADAAIARLTPTPEAKP